MKQQGYKVQSAQQENQKSEEFGHKKYSKVIQTFNIVGMQTISDCERLKSQIE